MKKKTILIIGSGLAGMEIANQLDKQKYDVIILEKGNITPQYDRQLTFLDRSFGPSPIRSINIGGTSALWHGAIMPPSDQEMSIGDQFQLPLDYTEFLSTQQSIIDRKIGDNPFKAGGNKIRKISNEMDFVQMAVPTRPPVSRLNGEAVLLSNVDKIELEFKSTAIDRVYFEVDGHTHQIKPDYLIVSCGGLGTPLLLNQILPIELRNENIGKRLIDHPMGYIGKAMLNEKFKKDFRLDKRHNHQYRLRRGFAVHDKSRNLSHCFYLRPTSDIGYDEDRILKKYKFVQYHRHNEFKNLMKLIDLDMVTEALFLKFGIDIGNHYSIICVSEQNTDQSNRIEGTDLNPTINWSFNEDFKTSINCAFDTFLCFLKPYLEDLNIFDDRFDRFWSASHISGTCRMSSNKQEIVIDRYFRYKHLDNLFVCDGSILPKIGYSNTGISILTLSNILASNFNNHNSL